ncbi:GEVED domain-containing protein [Epilithonimonas arachidiradicis]|uniref:Putative secreted protein (Por secretion system target) n=1 Tax=Epilithonimonas arachidiradicis TaxID=1617282 RepID=A0A420CXB4_9FLAO|nr:GEVED domain-containing protein [Epilithonimonas arachidiradicis]RKE83078.1 putative secreted protein (Por secretion system target) [Epilithonimonas arachidiradicis]GGG64846.1 hypothetical protein GCM10007332_29060 [Epilithonimonas arachidiradicis]
MKKHLLNLVLLSIPFFGFAQSNVLLNENFQAGTLPATWTVQQSNPVETWHVEDPLGGTDYRATVNYDESTAAQNEWLITPSLDFSESTTYTLTANIGLSYYWAVDPENNYDAFIKVSTDNGANWTQVWSENDLGVFTNWVMNPVTVNLSSYAGNANVKIAFQYVGADGAALYVDNIKVQKPASSAPDCATPALPANAATGVSYSSVALSWTAPSSGSSVDSYDVYLDKNTTPTTLLTNVTGTTYTATNLDPSSTYYWRIVPKNTAGSASGCVVYSFTTMAPTYCTAGATSTSWEKISNVTFADINNNSTATAGYEDFTAVTGNVEAGSTYTFTASFTGTSYDADQVTVWIDLNNDKDFNDAGEQVLVTAIKKSPWTGSITIPASATIGTTRMRVRLNDTSSSSSNTTPCGTSTFGQVEDYTLNIGQLAVNDVSKNGIKAYPNPVKDIFTIEAQGKIKSVKVFDVTGKQLLTKDLNEATSKIDFTKFNSGVYVVTTTMEDGSTTSTKVIKK